MPLKRSKYIVTSLIMYFLSDLKLRRWMLYQSSGKLFTN